MRYRNGLLGGPGQQSQFDHRDPVAQRQSLANFDRAGLANRLPGFAPPPPVKKKSFKDELQDGINIWLRDVEI